MTATTQTIAPTKKGPGAPISERVMKAWRKAVEELEAFFGDPNLKLPSSPLYLSRHEKIDDVQKFVDSHLSVIRNNEGNRTYGVYVQRLQKLKTYMIDHK